MKRMTTSAVIFSEKKLTNHSARKHLVPKLSDNNIDSNQITQITGHINIQSINNYSSLNDLQHINFSIILSNPTAPQRSLGSATFKFTQNSTAFRNTLNNSWATSTTINVTGGVQNLVNENILSGKIIVNIQTNQILHPKKGRVSSLTPTRMNDLDHGFKQKRNNTIPEVQS